MGLLPLLLSVLQPLLSALLLDDVAHDVADDGLRLLSVLFDAVAATLYVRILVDEGWS